MKHKYTDEEIQTAIDGACRETYKVHDVWSGLLCINEQDKNFSGDAPARLHFLKSALDKLPEPQPPTADGKTPGQVLYEILKTTNIAWGELAEWSREDIKDAAQAFLAAAREGFGPATVDWKSRHDELQKAYAGHADVTAALHDKVQKAEAELALMTLDYDKCRKERGELLNQRDQLLARPQLSTLRPIAEAGEVPAGCVRLTGARNDDGTWELAEAPATSFDTHCADFYLPDPLAEAVKRMEAVDLMPSVREFTTLGKTIGSAMQNLHARLIQAAKGEQP